MRSRPTPSHGDAASVARDEPRTILAMLGWQVCTCASDAMVARYAVGASASDLRTQVHLCRVPSWHTFSSAILRCANLLFNALQGSRRRSRLLSSLMFSRRSSFMAAVAAALARDSSSVMWSA